MHALALIEFLTLASLALGAHINEEHEAAPAAVLGKSAAASVATATHQVSRLSSAPSSPALTPSGSAYSESASDLANNLEAAGCSRISAVKGVFDEQFSDDNRLKQELERKFGVGVDASELIQAKQHILNSAVDNLAAGASADDAVKTALEGLRIDEVRAISGIILQAQTAVRTIVQHSGMVQEKETPHQESSASSSAADSTADAPAAQRSASAESASSASSSSQTQSSPPGASASSACGSPDDQACGEKCKLSDQLAGFCEPKSSGDADKYVCDKCVAKDGQCKAPVACSSSSSSSQTGPGGAPCVQYSSSAIFKTLDQVMGDVSGGENRLKDIPAGKSVEAKEAKADCAPNMLDDVAIKEHAKAQARAAFGQKATEPASDKKPSTLVQSSELNTQEQRSTSKFTQMVRHSKIAAVERHALEAAEAAKNKLLKQGASLDLAIRTAADDANQVREMAAKYEDTAEAKADRAANEARSKVLANAKQEAAEAARKMSESLAAVPAVADPECSEEIEKKICEGENLKQAYIQKQAEKAATRLKAEVMAEDEKRQFEKVSESSCDKDLPSIVEAATQAAISGAVTVADDPPPGPAEGSGDGKPVSNNGTQSASSGAASDAAAKRNDDSAAPATGAAAADTPTDDAG